eukprot:7023356-Ditylum_brightwellii.AAC.1
MDQAVLEVGDRMIVQANGTAKEDAALQWGAYKLSPFRDLGEVAMRKEWSGSWSTWHKLQIIRFIIRLTAHVRVEFQLYVNW